MIALAWPFVALVAIAFGTAIAHRLVLSRKAEEALQAQVAQLANRLEHSHRSMLDNQKRWVDTDAAFGKLVEQLAELRKRLETAELRRLGGGR